MHEIIQNRNANNQTILGLYFGIDNNKQYMHVIWAIHKDIHRTNNINSQYMFPSR